MTDIRTPLFLSNKAYDRSKFFVQIFLPALGTLYFSLGGLWNLPNADKVVGTVMAIDLFLGVLLGISSSQYNKSDAAFDGEMALTGSPLDPDPRLMVDLSMQDMVKKDEIRLKINRDDLDEH